tara:strand:- start:6588 stop:7106 length:519 start_codon:yes stop_codon:yes gene_type:complete
MTVSGLSDLEIKASKANLLLRLQIRRPLDLWSFKVVVAEELAANKIKIWGEMKGWAYAASTGLQLDTMRVSQKAPAGVGHLIWAATMSWALEATPCKKTRLLAIYDDESQHSRLIRYFRMRKFHLVREVSSSLIDLPLRMVWGGAGSLMVADCLEVLEHSYRLWEQNNLIKP